MSVIGIFDSGIGGISVLQEAVRMLPEPEYLYYADTEHVPYGTRSVEEIQGYAVHITRFLLEKGAECIVVACNTATSAAVELLREQFAVPIIGMEPAVKPALLQVPDTEGRTRVLLLATPLTLREEKLARLLQRYDTGHLVDMLALPFLVTMAEEGRFDEEEVSDGLRRALRDIEPARYKAVVPGCTHFHYFLPELMRLFPEGTCIADGNEGTVRRLSQLTGLILSEGAEEADVTKRTSFFFSGRQVRGEEELSRIRALAERAAKGRALIRLRKK